MSKKQLETLHKSVKKNKKLKESLETELKNERQKLNKSAAALAISSANGKSSPQDRSSSKNIRDVSARITTLDHVLKEKSQNLKEVAEGDKRELLLRHEIGNLRSTREHLKDQRQHLLERKLKRKEKKLSDKEERKLLECEEAVEAIDAAIEFKNELICGRRSVDTNESLQREKGEKMLMARLNNLSPEEMRILLYKYFQKVIDLRDSSQKLEADLEELKRERKQWKWEERVLHNAIYQAKLEGECHAARLQQEQEEKVALMLRHLAEETSASSSLTDHHMLAPQHHLPVNNLELDLYKPGSNSMANASFNNKQLIKSRHGGHMDLCPMPAESKYKPLDKVKEKDRESKNKLFSKFQVLQRYHGTSSTGIGGSGGDKRKVQDSSLSIPEHNLRHLQAAAPPLTVKKGTFEKNKLVIQQVGSQRH